MIMSEVAFGFFTLRREFANFSELLFLSYNRVGLFARDGACFVMCVRRTCGRFQCRYSGLQFYLLLPLVRIRSCVIRFLFLFEWSKSVVSGLNLTKGYKSEARHENDTTQASNDPDND